MSASDQSPCTRPVRPKGSPYHYLIVISGIMFTGITVSLICSCAGIFFTPVSRYFHVPKAAFTGYFSLFSITMVVFLPIAGRLMSRFDIRIVLTVSTLLAGIGCLCMSFCNRMWQFYICGVVMGMGMPSIIYLAVPTLINAWFTKRVGFCIGLCMAFTGIGGAIFNQLGNSIISSAPDGWRRGYLVFGLIILVATLPFTIFVVRTSPADMGLKPYGAEEVEEEAGPENKDSAECKTQEPEAQPPGRGMTAAQAMRSPAFWSMAVFCGLITMNQTIYQFLPSYATSIPSMATYAGLIASSCMVGQAVGKILLGMINDRNIVWGLGIGIGGGLLGVSLMWSFPSMTILLLLGAFGFGFVYACPTVQTPLLVRSVFGTRNYTDIYSRIQMAGSFASAFAALLWGMIVDLPHGYTILFGLSAMIMIAALDLGAWPLAWANKHPTRFDLHGSRPHSLSSRQTYQDPNPPGTDQEGSGP